ncbi:hypothetical protein RAD16_26900 [Bradyrhizobium sp. 18BD]
MAAPPQKLVAALMRKGRSVKSIRIDLPNGRFKGADYDLSVGSAYDYIGALVDFRLHERFAGNGGGAWK